MKSLSSQPKIFRRYLILTVNSLFVLLNTIFVCVKGQVFPFATTLDIFNGVHHMRAVIGMTKFRITAEKQGVPK